jgi:hypothetical protein
VDASLRLSLESDDSVGDLADLRDWLRQEPELRGHVRQVPQQPPPGHMGSLMDLAIVAAAAGGVLPVLASSVSAWLRRPRKSAVHLKFSTDDGRFLEVSAQRAADLEVLLPKLLGRGQE